MQQIVLLFIFLFSTDLIFAKNQISLVLTSPSLIEANAGEVLYLSALVCNDSTNTFESQVEICGPAGWSYSPSGFLNIYLQPNESKVLITGVKIPSLALAGEHILTLKISGYDELNCSGTVIVKPKIDVAGFVEGLNDSYSLSQKAQLSIRYRNNGNVTLRVLVETKTEPDCSLQCESGPFEILPYETFELPISLSPESCQEEHNQYLLIKLIDAESGEQLFQNPMTLKFYASAPMNDDPYVRVPAYFKMMALGDHNQYIGAGEFAGGGLIDKEKERYINFFFRVPTDANRVIYNVSQYLYAEIFDKEWDVVLGDTVYELSPLTQFHRFGRGAGIDHYGKEWSAGIHYTKNALQGGCNPEEFCTYLEFHPYKWLDISTNYMRKVEKDIPTTNIVSLQTDIEFPEKVFSEFEVGENFVNTKDRWNNSAYRFETHTKFCKDSWFRLEKVYAGPEFYGYYHHMHLLSSSLDFPICNQLRLNLNVNRLKQNFDACIEDDPETIIPRQHEYDASLTYRMNPSCSMAIYGMLLRSEDMGASDQYNFYQKWTGFSFSLTSCGYNLNSIISFGQQYDYDTKNTTHWLQRYYIFLGKTITDNLSGSIFYDGGNINYYDVKPWRSIYGAALNYKFSPRGSLELFTQKVNQTPDRVDLTQISVNLTYTFKNLHKFQAITQYFHYRKHYPNDTMFLISYSIPLNVPIQRRKDVGNLSGYVFNPSNDSYVSGALVGCSQRYTTTGENGHFFFPCLPVGEKKATVEFLPGDLIAKESDECSVTINGGLKSEVIVPVVNACSIRGVITLYEFENLAALIKDPNSPPKIVPLEGYANLNVAVAREPGNEIYSCITNAKGEFYFPKLRPGKWYIKIFTDQLPALHFLDMNHLILEIKPGEDRFISYKIIPQIPKIYKFETN